MSLEQDFALNSNTEQFCDGCGKHCPLSAPGCGYGRKKAQEAGLSVSDGNENHGRRENFSREEDHGRRESFSREEQSWAQPQASVAPSVKQVDGPGPGGLPSPPSCEVVPYLSAGALLKSSPCPCAPLTRGPQPQGPPGSPSPRKHIKSKKTHPYKAFFKKWGCYKNSASERLTL